MADLTNVELPTGFTTLDQIIGYAGLVYASIHPNDTYLLTEVAKEKVADRAIVRTYDGRDFLVVRAALPLNSEYTTGTNPLWTYVLPNSNVAVPARFKA